MVIAVVWLKIYDFFFFFFFFFLFFFFFFFPRRSGNLISCRGYNDDITLLPELIFDLWIVEMKLDLSLGHGQKWVGVNRK